MDQVLRGLFSNINLRENDFFKDMFQKVPAAGFNNFISMLNDKDRNEKYYEALSLAIDFQKNKGEKAIVLDIGTGTGLLSMMAVKCGADFVYTCENPQTDMAQYAETIIKENGCSDRIKVINKNSTNLKVGPNSDLKSKVNILVAEIFDVWLTGEDCIATFNHANLHLITGNCIIIPHSSQVICQIIESKLVYNWSSVNQIQVPLSIGITRNINFPAIINHCSKDTNAGLAIVLDEILTKGMVKPLSKEIKIFEFIWKGMNKENATHDSEFDAIQDGNYDGIAFWWDISLLPPNMKKIIISTKPKKPSVKEENYSWRFHWGQCLFFGQEQISISSSKKYNLRSFRDLDKFSFELCNVGENFRFSKYSPFKTCICGMFHMALNNYNIGLLNDSHQREMPVNYFKKEIKPNETQIMYIGQLSLIPLIALAFNPKLLLTFIEEKKNCSHLIALERLVTFAHLNSGNHQIETINDLKKFNPAKFKSLKIETVIGDIFAKYTEDPMEEIIKWTQEIYTLRNQFQTFFKTSPAIVNIRGIAVKFENLHKIKEDCSFIQVDDHRLDHRSWVNDQLYLKCDPQWFSRKNKKGLHYDDHFLHWYKSEASSEPFDIFKINLNNSRKFSHGTIQKKIVQLKNQANAIAIWCEYTLCEKYSENIVSNGPIGKTIVGQEIEWTTTSEQIVYFFPNDWKQTSKIKFICKLDENGQKFEFSHENIN